VLTIVALLVFSGVAGALVFWSMSWQSAWPGTEHPDEATRTGDAGTVAEGEPAAGGRRRRRERGGAAATGSLSSDGVPAAVAIIEHGEPYVPPTILGRLWAMVRLVLVVAVACGLVAGAIYFVATSISKMFPHGGG
jgi:hypothetical protein